MSDNKVHDLIEALKDIKYQTCVEVIDGCWLLYDNEIHWNTDYDKEDLYIGEGQTFSYEITDGQVEQDGYLITTGDTGTGYTVTVIAKLGDQVSIDYLSEVYGG